MSVTDESYVDKSASGVLNYNPGTFDNYNTISHIYIISDSFIRFALFEKKTNISMSGKHDLFVSCNWC